MWNKWDIGSRMVEIKKKTEIKAIETALEWLKKNVNKSVYKWIKSQFSLFNMEFSSIIKFYDIWIFPLQRKFFFQKSYALNS